MKFGDRLEIYGHRPEWKTAYCSHCGELRRTVFFMGSCPDHVGHPLYRPEPGRIGEYSPTRADTR